MIITMPVSGIVKVNSSISNDWNRSMRSVSSFRWITGELPNWPAKKT